MDTVGELISERAESHGSAVAVRIGAQSATYVELDERTSLLAGAYAGLGVVKGDRIAYLAGYDLELAVAVLAGYRVGAINVVLNEYLRGDPLRHQLGDADPTVIVVDGDGAETLAPVIGSLPNVRHVILVGDHGADALGGSPVDVVPMSDVLAGRSASFAAVSATDAAHIVYTSGTTGLPKGCVLSHQYILHQSSACAEYLGLSEDDRYLTGGPLYHVSGIHTLLGGMVAASSVIVDRPFSARRFWETVRQTGATVFFGLGNLCHALLAQPPADDDKQHPLRFFWTSAVPHEVQIEFEDRFGVTVQSEGYAQTEFSPVMLGDPENPPARRNTLGRPLSHVEVKVVDENDQQIAPGQTGEIILRPRRPGVMFDGYWRNAEATIKVWRDLWHRTGDAARLDEDGEYHFAGRKTDSMRRRGENVSAFEVEQVLLKHPSVAEAAVFGVLVSGEVDDAIHACLVLGGEAPFTIDDFAAFLRRELPYYASPRFVESVTELPRNENGRVTKHVLKARTEVGEVWDLDELGLTAKREDRRRQESTATP